MSNIKGYDETQDGQRIDNIPDTGELTGNWFIDHYGCWWEYKLDKPSTDPCLHDMAWIIGEYPEE